MGKIDTRNLIFHCSPFDSSDVWERNLSQLRRRWHVFNGKKIVSVSTGGGMERPRAVRKLLPDPEIEWLEFPNDHLMREATSFYPMLRLLTPAANEATFYAHAKGVTRAASDRRITDWRNQMYAHLLDRSDECMKLLLSRPCVGTYRVVNLPLGGMDFLARDLRAQSWHYSGTFFWFRNKDVLGHPNAFKVPMSGYAVEFYLSFLFSAEQSACIYRDNRPDPYHADHEPCPDPDDWRAAFEDEE